MHTKEVEARFLEINKKEFLGAALAAGARDFGEVLLEEQIFEDHERSWVQIHKFVRIRKKGNKVFLSQKQNFGSAIDSMHELEVEVSDYAKMGQILQNIGLLKVRELQKYRHTLELDGVTIDIDTWPKIPTYVELECSSEAQLKQVAKKLGLNWESAYFGDARAIFEKVYNIPLMELKLVTFERVE